MTKVSNKSSKVLRCALAAATAVAFTPTAALADVVAGSQDASGVVALEEQDGAEVTVAYSWDISAEQNESVAAVLYSDGSLVFSGTGEWGTSTPWKDHTGDIKSVTFGDGVQPSTLASYFQNCSNLTSVNRIPAVKDLSYAFDGCWSLEAVPDIPDGVENMSRTFNNCRALKAAPSIPDSVTNMSGTFADCYALTVAKVSANVEDLSNAFINCTSLETAPEIPSSVSVGCNDQSGTKGLYQTFYGCTSLKNVQSVITLYGPDNSSFILYVRNTFRGCTSLEAAPQFVCYISGTEDEYPGMVNLMYAFDGCTSLESVPSLPKYSYLDYAFQNCTALSTLPQIGGGYDYATYCKRMKWAFNGCTSLLSLPAGLTLPTAANIARAFYVDEALPMVLPASPAESVSGYNWSNFNRTAVTHDEFVAQLDAAIAEANALLDGVTISADGTDVPAGKQWVTQADADAVTAAIADATEAKTAEYPMYTALTALIDAVEGCVPAEGSAEAAVVYSWDMSSASDNSVTATLYTDGRLVFAGEGEMRGYSNRHDTPWLDDTAQSETGVDYKDSIKSVVFEDGVQPTTLKCYFQNCANLTSINRIPDTVTSLESTFLGCTSLKEIPAIPSSVTSMSSAFQGCTALETAPDIPGSVTNMDYAFSGCTALTTAKVSENVTRLQQAFKGCTSLETAPTIPAGVSCGSSSGGLVGTFEGCTSLKTVQDEISVVSSGSWLYVNSTFKGCTSLEVAPKFVCYDAEGEQFGGKTVFQETFSGCTALTTVPSLPSSTYNLAKTFNGCSSLASLPQVNGGYDYSTVGFMSGTFVECTKLVALPDGFKLNANNTSGVFKVSGDDPLEMKLPSAPDASLVSYDWGADNRTVQVGDSEEKTQLLSAIVEAKGHLKGVLVDDSAEGMPQNVLVVTQEQKDAFSAALTNAQSALAGEDEGVAAALSALASAVDTFDQAKVQGTLSCNSIAYWEIGKTVRSDVRAFMCDDGCLRFVGEGDTLNSVFWGSYKAQITKVEFGEGVAPTDISSWFMSCTNLEEVPLLPDSVTTMNYTFKYCSSLTRLADGFKMPSGLKSYTQAFLLSYGTQANMYVTGPADQSVLDFKWGGDSMRTLVVVASDQQIEELSAAIEDAEALSEGVQISADGTDVDTGEKWVTQEMADALSAAIEAAKALTAAEYPGYDATVEASEALASAVKAYVPAEGTMALSATATISGVEQVGDTATMTAEASRADATYQWYYSKDGGKTWFKASGTEATYEVVATAARADYQYKCLVKSGTESAFTNAVAIGLGFDATAEIEWADGRAVGNTATLSAAGAPEGATFQWYCSKDGGKTWFKASGTEATYEVVATASRAGYQYKCLVSARGYSAFTEPVAVGLAFEPVAEVSGFAEVGDTATLTASASEPAVSYQWYYSKDGGQTWAKASGTAAEYQVQVTATRAGYQYKCLVTSEAGYKAFTAPVGFGA